jgi:hypothetical protein
MSKHYFWVGEYLTVHSNMPDVYKYLGAERWEEALKTVETMQAALDSLRITCEVKLHEQGLSEVRQADTSTS